jgi:hypothetical protein
MGALHDFYEDLASYFSKAVGDIRFKAYDMEQPPPRDPRDGTNFPRTSSAQSLPSECAAALSYYSGTVPRPRKRGRVYIGPLALSVLDQAGSFPVLSTTFTEALGGAAVNNLMATTGVAWGLLSRTTGDIWPITAGWVDNAVDIQRRRGEDATARTEYPS